VSNETTKSQSEKNEEKNLCEFKVKLGMINVGSIHKSMNKSVVDAIEETIGVIIDVLFALETRKFVIVRFNPEEYDEPLHTKISVSNALEDEWGSEKVHEFFKDFYNTAMDIFAKERVRSGNNLLNAELGAVDQTVHCIAEAYDFDAYFIIAYDPSQPNLDAYRWAWVMVKK
jgi:hypothetical protein